MLSIVIGAWFFASGMGVWGVSCFFWYTYIVGVSYAATVAVAVFDHSPFSHRPPPSPSLPLPQCVDPAGRGEGNLFCRLGSP